MSQQKSHVRKDDLVVVLTGKDAGKRGVVLETLHSKNRAVVEEIHMAKMHLRPNQQGQGGIVEKEGTIHISNLKLICPKCNQPARTRRQVFEKDIGGRTKKRSLRVCKKCGEVAEHD